MKKRGRTDRRQSERDAKKLGDARVKLALLSEGGAPERPIVVESASVVEPRALALGCARCGGETRLDDHEAIAGLRRVRARCKHCNAVRVVWLQIAERLLS